MNLKKSIALVPAIALLGIGLTGCGNKDAAVNENGSYTYTMTMYQTRASNPNAIVLKNLEEKYNIKINVIDVEWQKYDEILNLKMAGGEVPDIIYVKTPAAAQKYADQDIAGSFPLSLLEEKAPNLLRRVSDTTGDVMKYYYVNGELYSIPQFSASSGPTGIPMVWRGDWLKNVGITKTPETLDEYEEAFYKFTNNDPDGNGVNDTYGLSSSGLVGVFAAYGYVPTLGQSGTPEGYWQERDGKLVYASIQPEMKAALGRISKWYADGVLDQEFITGENKGGYWAISHQFVNGIIGYTSHGMSYHWEPQFYADADPSTSGQDRYELAKINKTASDELIVSGKPPMLVAGQQPEYPKKPLVGKERWMFSKELVEDEGKFGRLLEIYNDIYASKENWDFSKNGAEGTVWEYEDAPALEGGTYKRTVYIGEWKDDEYRNNNLFNLAPFNPVFNDAEVFKTPRDDWATPKGFDKQYMPYTQLYVPLESSTKYNAELTKIEEEAYIDIITGAKPLDYFEEFVEKWRAAGGSVLEQEAQVWYDEVQANQ